MYSKLVLTVLYSISLLQAVLAVNGTHKGGFGGRRGRASSVIRADNGTASAIATVQTSVGDNASSVAASPTDSVQALGTDSVSPTTASPTAVATSSAAAGTGTGTVAADLALDSANIQTGSQSAGDAKAEKGQAASAT